MGNRSYADLQAFESNTDTSSTITFVGKPRMIVITNDSGTTDLTFKFNTAATAATLKPTETITLEMAAQVITLGGTNVEYRVWGLG